jgi:N,N'-diacetyllegionaminate synthase
MFNRFSLIAEIGSVHDGSFGNACKLIEAASTAGATAVKFQTHIAEAETLADAPMPSYFKGEPRMDYFRRTSFTLDQWKQLKSCCDSHRVAFMSSPFSLEAVDLLEEVGMDTYKIPSGEVSNLPLLQKIAALGKPIILSSGMSSWDEIDEAVKTLRQGIGDLLVMQCSSKYPCPPEKVGLNVMLEMQKRYGVSVGYSDHTLGMAACISAVALGATAVEKHFTFSRLMYGSDAQHSMEPTEFRHLADALHEVRSMLSNPVDKSLVDEYDKMKAIFQKSIVAARNLPKGTLLNESDLAYKKPGTGIGAEKYREVIGSYLNCDVARDSFILPKFLNSADS